jgi:hypothetical protein
VLRSEHYLDGIGFFAIIVIYGIYKFEHVMNLRKKKRSK